MERISLDRLTGLIAFARAASLGSYTAAARALAVSPSAVSKSVQRLEERLGIQLFHRTTRSLKLTAEGKDLHERTVKLLLQAEEVEQAALASRIEPVGALRVTAPFTIATHILAPALPRLRKRHPRLEIDLRSDDRRLDITDENIDIAVRVGPLPDSRFISRLLAQHRVCAFASPRYLASRGTPMTPDDIAGHDCVNFRFQSSGQELRWPFRSPDDHAIRELVPPTGTVLDHSEAVAMALAAGGGIGVSPTYVAASYVRRGELVPVLAPYAVDRFPIHALWTESRRRNPNVKAFVAVLADLFRAPCQWDRLVAEAAGLAPAWALPQADARTPRAARHPSRSRKLR